MRTVFGSWVVPNGLMPSHFHEGLAVLVETEKTKGGRGRSATFNAWKRMAVEAKVWGTDDFFSRDQLDGGVSRFPNGTTAYFFGYEFYKDLWARKGPEGIKAFVERMSSNWPYLLNGPLEEVYGKDSPTLWKEIFDKTRKETEKEIAEIKKSPLSSLKTLTQSKFLKWDLVYSPDETQFAYRRWNPEDGSAIDIVKIGSEAPIRTVETSGQNEGLCWGKVKDKNWLLVVDTQNSNLYQTNYLKAVELQTDKSFTLAAPNHSLSHVLRLNCDKSLTTLLVYQEAGGKGMLRELKWENKEKNEVKITREWPLPSGSWISGLAVGPTHWIGLRTGIKTELYTWNEGGAPKKQADFTAHLYNFRTLANDSFSTIASFSGRDEVWEWEPKKREFIKRVSLLGSANGFDISQNKILLSHYMQGGYDIALTEEQSLGTQAADREPNETTDTETPVKISEVKEYSAWGTLYPRTWIPSFLFVPDGMQFGVWVPGFDISQRHYYNLIGGYDTRGLPFASLDYSHRFSGNSSIEMNTFYLPSYVISSKQFFKRWGAAIGAGTSFSSSLPFFQFNLLFRRVESLDSLPANQSIGVQLSLSDSYGMKSRPLSISPIRGTQWAISHSQFFKDMGSTDNYFSTQASLTQYLEAPWWKEHVFYLNARLAYTEGTALYNNYFEAGGELLFYQERGTYLNRGFIPGLFIGRRIFNTSLEYRFPLATIERGIGYFPLKLKNLHAALVADTTSYDFGSMSSASKDLMKLFYVSSGVELRSNWTLGFYLPGQLRVGAYHGFGPYGESLYVTVGAQASL
jgi:hypothetical protein